MVAAFYLKANMEQIHGMFAPQIRRVNKVRIGMITYVMSLPRLM